MAAQDAQFMKFALREARKGIGKTSPNPTVGAIVVKNGEIVGKGYHHRAGTPHAEIHALRAAGKQARGGTIYVTLEPCNHTGRTPPCTEAILAAGIRRVVIGMPDPNPNVTGGGSKYLAANGIDVVSGILEDRCREINLPFVKHTVTGLPWEIINAGLSVDGRIATCTGHSTWITGEQSRLHVHRLRNEVDAILVGRGTAVGDNPSLTTRLPTGKGRDPVRVVLDTHLSLPPDAQMLVQKSSSPTLIFCGPHPDAAKMARIQKAGATVISVGFSDEGLLDLRQVLLELGKKQLNSVLVEGGGQVHGSLLRKRLADQAIFFVAPILLGGDGVPVLDSLGVMKVQDAPRLRNVKTRRFGDDILIEGRFSTSHF